MVSFAGGCTNNDKGNLFGERKNTHMHIYILYIYVVFVWEHKYQGL